MVIGAAPILLVASASASDSPDRRRSAEAIDATDWITADDYPPAAIRAGEHGIVAVKLDIGNNGRVTGCAVTGSSGSVTLDAATCSILVLRARFQPALDREGAPIAAISTRRIAWQIPADPESPIVLDADGSLPPSLATTVTVSTDPQGKIVACTTTARTPHDGVGGQADPCSEFTAGQPLIPVHVRQGRPVGAKVRISWSQTVDYDP